MNGDLASIFGAEFDSSVYAPQADFDAVPAGKYPVLIESAEVKRTKAGTGHYIKIQASVLEGSCKNRKIFDNINIQNPSDQCVEIGMRQLTALAQALGLQSIADTSQLVNRAVVAHVKVKNEQNEIRTYSAYDDAASVQQQYVAQGQPSPQPPIPLKAPPTQQMQTQYQQPAQQMQTQYQQPAQQAPPTQNTPGKPPWQR